VFYRASVRGEAGSLFHLLEHGTSLVNITSHGKQSVEDHQSVHSVHTMVIDCARDAATSLWGTAQLLSVFFAPVVLHSRKSGWLDGESNTCQKFSPVPP